MSVRWFKGGDPAAGDWAGSLIRGQQDISGLMYRRNRYYDPQTGQFTQSDPIGIAGGLNAYGFGNGDPVSYADPYGLCAVRGDLGPIDLRVWMMPTLVQAGHFMAQRTNALRTSESMRESLAMILSQGPHDIYAYYVSEDRHTTSAMQDRLGDCLRACERGGEAIERFCRSIPIKERRVRSLCWAVTKGSEPLCKGFCYAREWEGWPW